ncbi:hypothetical protein [Amycolatopsis sp. RTGN1]|uniref:SbtR family transcriptional regulator n=1 Tax=Amycolatopsis ponsaeliensis TaxID=2992142 RepID=UPI00254F2708|nr:hypothetical protein [Amycolatopsis sp. RTGN1]
MHAWRGRPVASPSTAGHDLGQVLAELLAAAQRAGAVRPDVDAADVKAFLVGCAARERDDIDAAARGRMLSVIHDGLRAANSHP